MKINNMANSGVLWKSSSAKTGGGEATIKDEFVFGEGSENLGIMEKPLECMKSGDINPAGIFLGPWSPRCRRGSCCWCWSSWKTS